MEFVTSEEKKKYLRSYQTRYSVTITVRVKIGKLVKKFMFLSIEKKKVICYIDQVFLHVNLSKLYSGLQAFSRSMLVYRLLTLQLYGDRLRLLTQKAYLQRMCVLLKSVL